MYPLFKYTFTLHFWFRCIFHLTEALVLQDGRDSEELLSLWDKAETLDYKAWEVVPRHFREDYPYQVELNTSFLLYRCFHKVNPIAH